MHRAAIVSFVALVSVFAVLALTAEGSLFALACYEVLLLPGILVKTIATGNPHSVGAGTAVVAFALDYLLLLCVIAVFKRRATEPPMADHSTH